MKRVLVLFALVSLVLCFGTASAQTHKVMLDHVVGLDKTGGLVSGSPVEFHIRAINDGSPTCMYNAGFGFRVYSTDGAKWDTTTIGPALLRIDTMEIQGHIIPDTVTFDKLFTRTFTESQGVDGQGADSVGYSGLTMGGKDPGIRDGFDHPILIVTIYPTAESKGKHLCLDAAKQMPSYEWEWSGLGLNNTDPCEIQDVAAEWDGPHCFEIH